jgi:glycosyltransferase involved in cell wall biosynthesis
VPCYNEGLRLNLDAFADALSAYETVDFIFTDDGSTDNTLNLLTAFNKKFPGRTAICQIAKNRGKANAIRHAILQLDPYKYSAIGYWDADLATPLDEIPRFLERLRSPIRICLGSRWKHLGSQIERNEKRHWIGRVFATFASNILRLPVYDTQCGAKIFSSEIQPLFQEPFVSSWTFDVELLARYRNKYGLQNTFETVVEIPLNTWVDKKGSKLRFSHMLRVPFELLRITLKYN